MRGKRFNNFGINLGRGMAMLVLSALSSCGHSTGLPPQLPASPEPALAGLPPIPYDASGARGVSANQDSTMFGADTYFRSAGAVVSGSNLVLPARAGSFEWGIWRHAVPEGVPQTAQFDYSVSGGQQGWIGIANYGKGYWDFTGAYPAKTIGQLAQGQYISPGGNMYFLVLAFEGTTVTVSSLTATVDIPVPQTYSISGKATDTSSVSGLNGVTITLSPGGQQAVTGGGGLYSFTGISAGSYTLTPVLAGYTFTPFSTKVTLGPDAPGIDFSAAPDQVPVTYTNAMKSVFDANCIACHGSSLARGGYRFDTYASASAGASAGLQAVLANAMPQGAPPLSAEDKQAFKDWVNGGKPQ